MQQFTCTTAANTRKRGTKNKKHKEKQKKYQRLDRLTG